MKWKYPRVILLYSEDRMDVIVLIIFAYHSFHVPLLVELFVLKKLQIGWF